LYIYLILFQFFVCNPGIFIGLQTVRGNQNSLNLFNSSNLSKCCAI